MNIKMKWGDVLVWLILVWIGVRAGVRYDDVTQAMLYTIAVGIVTFFIYRLLSKLWPLEKSKKIDPNDPSGWYVFMQRERHANIAFGPFVSQAKAEHELEFGNFINNYKQEDCLDAWTMWSHGTDIDKGWVTWTRPSRNQDLCLFTSE